MEQPKRTGRNLGRAIAAFVVGPLVASTTAAVLEVVLADLVLGSRAFECFDCYIPSAFLGFVLFLIFSLMFEYFAAAVIGLVVVGGHLLFRHIGWKRRSHCFMLGALIGCAAGGLITISGLDLSKEVFSADGLSVGWVTVQNLVSTLVLALVTGLMFAWLLLPKAANNDDVVSKSG